MYFFTILGLNTMDIATEFNIKKSITMQKAASSERIADQYYIIFDKTQGNRSYMML